MSQSIYPNKTSKISCCFTKIHVCLYVRITIYKISTHLPVSGVLSVPVPTPFVVYTTCLFTEGWLCRITHCMFVIVHPYSSYSTGKPLQWMAKPFTFPIESHPVVSLVSLALPLSM